MKIKDYSKEELETMSYTQIAEIILTEKGNAMKIVDIFKKVCKALKMSEAEFENKIADFFELLSTDKNFIILDKGKCDLRKRHDFKVVVEEEDEEESVETVVVEEDTPEEKTEEEDIFYDNSSDEDDIDDKDDEDELRDFIVVDEDDEEAGM